MQGPERRRIPGCLAELEPGHDHDRSGHGRRDLYSALRVCGLMNIQFAIQNGDIYVLEVNPRASRTVPFVTKAVGSPIASIAARRMAGEPLAAFRLKAPETYHFSVKEAELPFSRFPGVDSLFGPGMRSAGEAMGIDLSFEGAFLKAQIGAGVILSAAGHVLISVRNGDKTLALLESAAILSKLGFGIQTTNGTAKLLKFQGFRCAHVNKVY